MKKLFVMLAAVCVLCVLCGCGQEGTEPTTVEVSAVQTVTASVKLGKAGFLGGAKVGDSGVAAQKLWSYDPAFSETRSANESVLIADITRIWGGVFQVNDGGELYAVLECTVRWVIEAGELNGEPVEERLSAGDCFFLWLSLDKWEMEEADIAETMEILKTLQSLAVWGNPRTLTFGPLQEDYAQIQEEYGRTGVDGVINIKPSIVKASPIWSWRIIPITDGVVDAEPVERLNDIIYDGQYTMYFDLDEPMPQFGMYFAEGDTEEEFVTAVQKFSEEQDAGKEWKREDPWAEEYKRYLVTQFFRVVFWMAAGIGGMILLVAIQNRLRSKKYK